MLDLVVRPGRTEIVIRVRMAAAMFVTLPAATGTAMRVSEIFTLFSLIRQPAFRAECYARTSLTGVRSREPSSSVALAAASIRSSHRLPYKAAALGSPVKDLRSPLSLLSSFDRFRSCLANRAD